MNKNLAEIFLTLSIISGFFVYIFKDIKSNSVKNITSSIFITIFIFFVASLIGAKITKIIQSDGVNEFAIGISILSLAVSILSIVSSINNKK